VELVCEAEQLVRSNELERGIKIIMIMIIIIIIIIFAN